MRNVTNLDQFRKAKNAKTKNQENCVESRSPWKEDKMLRMLTPPGVIRNIVIDALQQLHINPADNRGAIRGRHIYLTVDEVQMRKECLTKDDIFRSLRDTIQRRTALPAELMFIHPRTKDDALLIQLLLP
jgi:hypothetical protein